MSIKTGTSAARFQQLLSEPSSNFWLGYVQDVVVAVPGHAASEFGGYLAQGANLRQDVWLDGGIFKIRDFLRVPFHEASEDLGHLLPLAYLLVFKHVGLNTLNTPDDSLLFLLYASLDQNTYGFLDFPLPPHSGYQGPDRLPQMLLGRVRRPV